MDRNPGPGISGIALYLPPYRVDLDEWCGWTGGNFNKVSQVVGTGFRMAAPGQTLYALAANAVLKLIRQYDIDPARVGYLALGTESSTDNAAGAVIVRGLVDMALQAAGKPSLARDCEVPEYKHACLGGIYAMKGALRYLASDGADRLAMVVSADIAEYARGSSGEPTQGAGAVAMLLEAAPKLLALDLARAGSASSFRGLDFRKPFLRFAAQTPGTHGKLQDFPVFNGRYSTTCYIDETFAAMDALHRHHTGSQHRWLQQLAAVFMHRPYHHMPRSAWALVCLRALALDAATGDADANATLVQLCAEAGVSPAQVVTEMRQTPEVSRPAGGALDLEPWPETQQLARTFRGLPSYREAVESKMRLGSMAMLELGNLYTAALPAWLAAGLEEAAGLAVLEAGASLLVAGYGSGDAAEAIPARLVDGWQAAAARIGFAAALADAVTLTQPQYEALHAGRLPADLPTPHSGLMVERVGTATSGECQDFGIEYYRCLGEP